MEYTCTYQTPLGDILLAADEIALLELEHTDMSHFFVPKKEIAL